MIDKELLRVPRLLQVNQTVSLTLVNLGGPVMTGLSRSYRLPVLRIFYLIVSVLSLQTSFHRSGYFMKLYFA